METKWEDLNPNRIGVHDAISNLYSPKAWTFHTNAFLFFFFENIRLKAELELKDIFEKKLENQATYSKESKLKTLEKKNRKRKETSNSNSNSKKRNRKRC